MVKNASMIAGGLPYMLNMPLSEIFIFSTFGETPLLFSLGTHSGGAVKRKVLYFLVTDEMILRASIIVDLPALLRPTKMDVPLKKIEVFS